ncbi:MAG: DNA translocase FtsK [Alphaproteobacteria bacterium]|nr:MAG: DNA translocase FtsK [Alphaproteobacteria bacterium]
MNIQVLSKRIVIVCLAVMLLIYDPKQASLFTSTTLAQNSFFYTVINNISSLLYQLLGYGVWVVLGLLFVNLSLKRSLGVAALVQWNFITFSETLSWKGILPYAGYQLFLIEYIPAYILMPVSLCIAGFLMLPLMNVEMRMPVKRRAAKKEEIEEDYYTVPEVPQARFQPEETEANAVPLPSRKETLFGFDLPPLNLLEKKYAGSSYMSDRMTAQISQDLLRVLEEFGVRGEMGKVFSGPVVTLYEFIPAPGIKTSRVVSLSDDIARSMSAVSVRISVVPGQNVIGIELPNKKRNAVYLRHLLESDEFNDSRGALNLALGQDIMGSSVVVDLAKMPHLLIAGTTGSGKSVGINTMILSLLFKLTPKECRFVMIDPKMLELSVYDGIPHLLAPVVTDPKKAVSVLKWAVKEMQDRYMAMSKLGVRNIDGYNARIKQAKESGEVLQQRLHIGFDQESGKPIYENKVIEYKTLPYIVIVVDEMADLMMVAGKEIEVCVQRLAQMARAAGLHLVMATQRPSVDVITGTIKANFPTRVSFHVTSKIDSRTILGEQGAEQLLGQGDMLYMANGGKIVRIHGAFASDEEVRSVVKHLKKQHHEADDMMIDFEQELGFTSDDDSVGDENDPMYRKAVDLIMQEGKVSTSFLQRKLQIGYNRAARIVDEMEEKGVVSSADHTGKRQIMA